MIAKYFLPSFILLILITSCGSKKIVEDTRPDWIKTREISNVDYLGIGKSSKVKSPYNYIQLAKKKALADISSEISVNISSNSILSTVETTEGFAEIYSSLIRSKAKKDLEGYELITTYQTDTDYWCYYRLNKAKYRRLREKKKQIAISKSLDFYDRSKEVEKSNDLKTAIILNIKAIGAIKDYWSEKNEIERNSSKMLLGNELISNQINLISSVKITPIHSRIKAIRGKSISNDLLSFVVEDLNNNKQQGLPVLFDFSEKRLSNNNKVSNEEGKISYAFKKIKSSKTDVYFRCKLDISSLIDEASDDYMLHNLLDEIKEPDGAIKISLKNPIIYIHSDEKIFGEKQQAIISRVLKNYFKEKGLEVSTKRKNSDFEINIYSDTQKASRNYDGVYTSNLVLFVEMKSGGVVEYSTTISEIHGRGSSYFRASENAYSKAKDDIRIKVGNQIYRNIFD